MGEIPPQTLWIELQQGRYFLMREGKKLPEGETLLFSPSGLSCRVDLAGVVAWEVPESAALAYLQINATQYFLDLRERVLGWQSWGESLNTDSSAQAGLAGDSLLASLLLGFTPEEARQDPHAPLLGLRHLVLRIADLIEDSIAGNEEQLEQARQNLRLVTAQLRAQSIEI